MDINNPLVKALSQLTEDIRLFIELSLQETDASWDEWLDHVMQDISIKCWERKNCSKDDCPAYRNIKGRCWLIAGTMCSGRVQGEFALKYKSCTECEVFQESVFTDPVTEIYEHILTLVHSLKNTQEKLKTLAVRDSLTGVFNRNFFNEVILNEIERTRRYGQAFLIIMIDIDHFKYINDTFGHLHGDRMLRECATVLGSAIRSSDLLVRYGGDEFVIISPFDQGEPCDHILERIYMQIAEWNSFNKDGEYRLSVSLGCSRFEQGKNLMEVIAEADQQMYVKKEQKGAGNGSPSTRQD